MASGKRKPKAKPSNHPIFPLAQKKWQSSGLSDDQAACLLLGPLTGEEVKALGGNFAPVGSVQIPYFDLDGKPTEFYRLRYLEPLPGFLGQAEKPQRYAQPKGTLNEVYFPPIIEGGVSWRDVAEDPDVPILITEGEFKSAAACGVGLACFGLGGVDVWRSTKRGIDLLPALKEFNWKNRNVTIVFDSDAASNPNVVRAQRQLASTLLGLSALPNIAAIPSRSDGGKQGLDDLLVSEGRQALDAIIQDAPAYQEADALWGLNEEVVYVRDPGIVVERETGRKMEPNRFVSHAYANRHYIEIQSTAKGGVVAKKKPLARRWIEWEGRSEVSQIVYEPGQPRLAGGAWNAWEGWGCEPKKGDVGLWKDLLDFLFKKEHEARDWFERWLAYPIQHPGTKLYSACVLWSVNHGMGKGLCEYTAAAIYGKNAIEIGAEDLRGSFNAWAENRQFVIGNEITAGEARLDKDKLKRLITRKDITINQKFMPEYTVRDCVNYIFDGNGPDTLFIEDNDRRYFVHEVVGARPDPEFIARYDAFLNGAVRNSGKGPGPAAVFHHLLNLDLKGFNPSAPALETASKRAMMINGKSDLGAWVQLLKEDPSSALRPLRPVVGDRAAQECDLFPAQVLLRAYDPDNSKRATAPGLAREMLRAGFRQCHGGTTIRTKGGITRLYAVRNAERWTAATPRALAAHYDQFFDGAKFA